MHYVKVQVLQETASKAIKQLIKIQNDLQVASLGQVDKNFHNLIVSPKSM